MISKKRFILFIVAALSLLLIAGGCANQQTKEKVETVKIKDMAGREVEVPNKVEEVVGVGPGALRLIVHLGGAEKVIGVEEGEKRENWGGPYNLAHPEFKDLPTIGPNHGGDAELIAAQGPDVIFFYGDSEKAESLQQKTGIPVVIIKYVDLGPDRDKLLYESWRLIGQVLNKEDRAEELIKYTEELIADLKERTEDIPEQEKPKVYAGAVSYHGGHGIVSTKVPFPPFAFLNAKYVAEELGYEKINSLMINKEKLLEWNPELVFVDESNLNLVKKDLEKHSGYNSITGIKQGNVYGFLPYASYHRNPATILANTYYMGQVLYPDRFSDIDPAKKADKIYKKFVGAPVYDQMKETFGGFKRINLN